MSLQCKVRRPRRALGDRSSVAAMAAIILSATGISLTAPAGAAFRSESGTAIEAFVFVDRTSGQSFVSGEADELECGRTLAATGRESIYLKSNGQGFTVSGDRALPRIRTAFGPVSNASDRQRDLAREQAVVSDLYAKTGKDLAIVDARFQQQAALLRLQQQSGSENGQLVRDWALSGAKRDALRMIISRLKRAQGSLIQQQADASLELNAALRSSGSRMAALLAQAREEGFAHKVRDSGRSCRIDR